jgi:rhamnose transport system permease protein
VIVSGDRIDPESIPGGFTAVGYKNFFGIPWLAIIVAAVVVLVGYGMRSFRASRDLYAIGSNPDAAALAGIPIERRVFTAFLISGTLAGLAGALFLALHTQIDNSGGAGYELKVVAAVVVGGVAIFGGSGTVLGAALGALLLNTINQALVASRISAFWNDAIAGALLLVAIAFDRWLTLRVTKTLQSAEGAHRDL